MIGSDEPDRTDRIEAAGDGMVTAVWEPLPSSSPGPTLGAVTARLRATPGDVLAEHLVLLALVHDTLDLVEERSPADVLAHHGDVVDLGLTDPAARLAAAVTCWLLTAPEVVVALPRPRAEWALAAIRAMAELVTVLPLRNWLSDDEDRQEEVARALLRSLSLRPSGETHELAEDRWTSISSASRRDALRLAAQHQAWAEEVARKLREERAREAAAQYTHV